MCRHESNMLMGTADGIVCRGCGKVFHSFFELVGDAKLDPDAPIKSPAPAEKPKRTRKKKEDA